MTKLEFITALTGKLSGMPWKDVEERVNFYSEAIEDRIEEGLPEEEAVAAVGSPEDIAAQILGEFSSVPADVPRKEHKRKLSAVEIVLLVLGSPLWLSLLIAVAAIVISLYASLWAVVISVWAVFISFVVCAVGGVAGGAFLTFVNRSSGIFLIGAGIFCAGAAIFLFHGCIAATKGAVQLAVYLINKLFRRNRREV